MVIDRGAFLAGDYLTVFNQIAEVKAVCGDVHLKVIMETGELVTYDNVRRQPPTCRCWPAATSSRPPPARSSRPPPCPSPSSCSRPCATGATLTGVQVGVKPAGGIRTTKDAIKYLVMVSEIAGDDWLTPDLVPASAPRACSTTFSCNGRSLATGAYSGADYVTID